MLEELAGDEMTPCPATSLDAPDTMVFHAQLISKKKFLRKLYADYYAIFREHLAPLATTSGLCIELGSGGGFLKEVLPHVITSDVHTGPGIDRVIQADHLPYGIGEVKAIFLLNVFHHLSNPSNLLKEAERVLAPRGRLIMIEPFNSVWARFFYKYLHHEPFDEKSPDWRQEDKGRLSTSNQALAWIIFHRDRLIFEKKFPALRIVSIKPHTVTRYLFSGGLSFRASAPAATYSLFRLMDHVLERFEAFFPVFQTVVLEKRG